MLFAWLYQAITLINNVDSSKVFYDIHLTVISQEILINLNRNVWSGITLFKLLPHPAGANELRELDHLPTSLCRLFVNEYLYSYIKKIIFALLIINSGRHFAREV